MSSSCSKKIFAKIDDRGRIYLPAKIRRFCKSVSFSADLANRRIFLSANGLYNIDSKGRVSIPADIRRSLGLVSGSIIEFGGEKNGISRTWDKEPQEISDEELYRLGEQIYRDEQPWMRLFPRSAFINLTPLGEMTLNRYLRGK